MTPITSGRMTIIPTLEKDGWALPANEWPTQNQKYAFAIAKQMDKFMCPDLTNEQRKHYIENGGDGLCTECLITSSRHRLANIDKNLHYRQNA